MSHSSNWNTITESNFPWEREALDFVRQQFPTQDPYRAGSNFEFIAIDGSINEVDLLVFTPQGSQGERDNDAMAVDGVDN